MKLLLSIVAYTLIALPHSLLAQAKSADEFTTAYKTAIQEKNAQKLEALVYAKGIPESTRQEAARSRALTSFMSDQEIESVTLTPLPKDFQSIKIGNGKKYEIIPSPSGYIQIQRGGIVTSLNPYAIVDGLYYLTSAKITDLKWTGPQDKLLMFSIEGTGNDKVTVVVKWNVSGVDQERTYPNSSGLSLMGQYISEVTVTSDQVATDVTLRILEATQEIYKSEALKGVGTIHYKKKAP